MTIKGFRAVVLSTVAIAAGLTLAAPASATVHQLTYQGVVTSALDNTAEFGAGASLVGMSFTALVTYDDAKAGATHSGDTYYDNYAGSGAANPVTATIMLNGVSRSFGATYGQDSRLDRSLQPGCLSDCTEVSFQQHAKDEYTKDGFYTLNYINLGGTSSNGALSGLAHTAPDFTNPPIDLYAYVNLFEQDIFTLDATHYAMVSVRIDSVTGGVPEPATWALMLMGFGGAGALLRRRRADALASA